MSSLLSTKEKDKKTKKLESILTPQTAKITKNINKVLDYNLELTSNVDKIKDKFGEYARKDINTNFIDRLTRKIYMNPNYLSQIEFFQYILFVGLLYFYNPFNINSKYPGLSKLLILSVAFLYVVLFFFVKLKLEAGDDVDLIAPTENNVILQFIGTIIFFVLFMLAIKGVIWLFINTPLVKLLHNLMATFIVICILSLLYLFMRKSINKAKNVQSKSIVKFCLKFIMFIPCLLVDLAEYIKFEYHLTTKPVWILLGMEASVVGLLFIIPYLFGKIANYGGLKLLTEPVNLNEETAVGNFSNATNPNDSGLSIDQMYNKLVNEKAQQNIDQNPDTLDNAPNKKYDCDPNEPKNKILAWFYNVYHHGISLKVNFSKHPQYTDSKTDRFAYKYSLSGWFYINPQPPNTNHAYSVYTNILNYGKKIKIEYNGKINSLRVMAAVASKGDKFAKGSANTYQDLNTNTSDLKENDVNVKKDDILRYGIKSDDTKSGGTSRVNANAADVNNMSEEVYKTNDIMYQKWNNIVVNYDAGNVDVFYNGVLVGSVADAVPYMTFDTIIAGAHNGIIGGVCNINYYTDPLSASTIKTIYKSLRIKNIPYV
jgi:hypothetical protein